MDTIHHSGGCRKQHDAGIVGTKQASRLLSRIHSGPSRDRGVGVAFAVLRWYGGRTRVLTEDAEGAHVVTAPFSAHDAARYFLASQDEEAGELISNLKLQKLLYYAQGFHLALFARPLFSDKVKAWQYGPVVPDVWHRYRDSGFGPIGAPKDFDASRYDPDTRDLLDEINRVYGQYSATKLRDLTHEEPPWRDAWERRQAGGSDEITQDSLRDYFQSLLAT
jgi:uncharacterized phage-associated protein